MTTHLQKLEASYGAMAEEAASLQVKIGGLLQVGGLPFTEEEVRVLLRALYLDQAHHEAGPSTHLKWCRDHQGQTWSSTGIARSVSEFYSYCPLCEEEERRNNGN